MRWIRDVGTFFQNTYICQKMCAIIPCKPSSRGIEGDTMFVTYQVHGSPTEVMVRHAGGLNEHVVIQHSPAHARMPGSLPCLVHVGIAATEQKEQVMGNSL